VGRWCSRYGPTPLSTSAASGLHPPLPPVAALPLTICSMHVCACMLPTPCAPSNHGRTHLLAQVLPRPAMPRQRRHGQAGGRAASNGDVGARVSARRACMRACAHAQGATHPLSHTHTRTRIHTHARRHEHSRAAALVRRERPCVRGGASVGHHPSAIRARPPRRRP